MKLICWYCHKPVTGELPDNTIFRGIAICPECIETGKDMEGLDDEIIEALVENAKMRERAIEIAKNTMIFISEGQGIWKEFKQDERSRIASGAKTVMDALAEALREE